MWESALWFILGIAAKYFIRGSFWDTKFMRDWQSRRQQEELNETLNKSRPHLTIGALQIDQMMAQIFNPPLTRADVLCHFEPPPRSLPSDIQELEFDYLPRKVSQMKSQGKAADFNDLYGLKAIRIERPQRQGERLNRPELFFEPTNFKYYLMANACLDKPLLPGSTQGPVSIRQRHALDLSDFQWSDVAKIPLHQWFATVTGVVTNDNQLVVAIRSTMQSIQEPESESVWQASLSCAEGMLRPVDSITPPPVETPSPFATVCRALSDELGLEPGEHYQEPQVKLLGIGYDKRRCQPVGVFCLELEDRGFLDVDDCWKTAKDRHENMTLMPVAVEPKSVAELLLGKLTYKEKPVRLFSNHQELGALLVAFYRLGVKSVKVALS